MPGHTEQHPRSEPMIDGRTVAVRVAKPDFKRADIIAVRVAKGIGYSAAAGIALVVVVVLACLLSGAQQEAELRRQLGAGGAFASVLQGATLVRIQHDDFTSSAEFALAPEEAVALERRLVDAVELGGTEYSWMRTPVPDSVSALLEGDMDKLAARPDGYMSRREGDVLVVFPGERRAYLFRRLGGGVF